MAVATAPHRFFCLHPFEWSSRQVRQLSTPGPPYGKGPLTWNDSSPDVAIRRLRPYVVAVTKRAHIVVCGDPRAGLTRCHMREVNHAGNEETRNWGQPVRASSLACRRQAVPANLAMVGPAWRRLPVFPGPRTHQCGNVDSNVAIAEISPKIAINSPKPSWSRSPGFFGVTVPLPSLERAPRTPCAEREPGGPRVAVCRDVSFEDPVGSSYPTPPVAVARGATRRRATRVDQYRKVSAPSNASNQWVAS